MEIIGWIVWGLACAWAVFGFRAFITNPRRLSLPWYDAPILKTIVGGVYLAGMIAAIAATFVLDISKLHLLWFIPVFTILSKVVPAWIYTGVTKTVFGGSNTDEEKQ